MGRFPWAIAVVTSILIGGCSLPFGSDEPDLSPVTESPAPQPSQPLASLPPEPNPILIQPTNPDQRLRRLKSGRADPFQTLASATGPSGTKLRAGPSGTGSAIGPSDVGLRARLGGMSSGAGPSGTGLRAKLGSTGSGLLATTRSATSGSLCGAPRGAKSASSSTLRAPGTPAVLISGIVLVGGVSRAVIKAPDERVSRTVRVGERLSSGTLVKAIYTNQAKPVVILEQNGFSVSRGVGEVLSPPQIGSTIPVPGIAGAFGLVRGLALNSVNVSEAVSPSQPLVAGVICNNTNKVLKVAQITLQLEDKSNGTVINSFPVNFAAPYVLRPGQKAEFDERLKNTELGLRGRDKGQTITKLGGWS